MSATPMNYSCDSIPLNRKVEITDFMSNYFNPAPITFQVVEDGQVTDKVRPQPNYRIIQWSFSYFKITDKEGNTTVCDDSIFDKYLFGLFEKEEADKHLTILQDIFLLHIADHWLNYLEMSAKLSEEQACASNSIVLLEKMYKLLNIYENRKDAEIYIRERKEGHNVDTSKTITLRNTEYEDSFDEMFLPYFYQMKANFIYNLGIRSYLNEEDLKEFRQYYSEDDDISFDFGIHEEARLQMSMKTLKGQEFELTSVHLKEVHDTLYSFVYPDKSEARYQLLKIVVPQLSKYIDDHAKAKFKKKDKYMLIFNLTRSFGMLPREYNRVRLPITYNEGAELIDINKYNGNIDKKEDFIKQLLR